MQGETQGMALENSKTCALSQPQLSNLSLSEFIKIQFLGDNLAALDCYVLTGGKRHLLAKNIHIVNTAQE